jgi:hypothetical protein
VSQDLPEEIIALEYLRSTSTPSVEDAKLCLAELERLMLPCSSMTTEYILERLRIGFTGEQLCYDYMAYRQEKQQLDQAANLQQRFSGVFDIGDSDRRLNFEAPNAVLEDVLWFELLYGLLYATTHLPLKPVVMRHVSWSRDQYDTYYGY